ncbi:hypothetical protein WDZ16_03905 [Pseudokineococcus marinus]|uniref:Uncharacterized protein n=1 Tax=Pseudokineococcus marinus TaxID=351215 RepID=A0A849BVE5_9ACTN|nr:hypothetical protein [Pseudokineococcus marinus]NNH24364.1 hypothetical protein [Pseudokineococcus marinus]
MSRPEASRGGAARRGAPPEPPAWLREVLRCPATGGPLEDRRDADGRLVGLLSTSAEPPLLYPVVDGVPVLLVDEGVPQTSSGPSPEGSSSSVRGEPAGG